MYIEYVLNQILNSKAYFQPRRMNRKGAIDFQFSVLANLVFEFPKGRDTKVNLVNGHEVSKSDTSVPIHKMQKFSLSRYILEVSPS